MEALKNIGLLFVEPGKAMEAVRARSMLVLPLVLLLVGTAAVQLWYYQTVDFPWLLDHMFGAQSGMDPDQAEAAKKFMTPGMMAGSSVAGTLIVLPLMLLLQAVYLLLAARVVGNDLPFGKWFAFATWTSVPSLLLIPVMAPWFDRPVATYSLGTRQKLAILVALHGDPPLLVLDEILNGLDPLAAYELKQELRRRAATGTTVLLATHGLEVAERFLDRALLLLDGRIAADWNAADLAAFRTDPDGGLEHAVMERLRARAPQ